MRVLVVVLLIGIAGCGGEETSPADVATPSSPVKAENAVAGASEAKAAAKKAIEGQEPLTLRRHSGPVLSVRFSPDGKRIVSGSDDDTVKVWDAQTGQETFTLKGHSGSVYSVSFSPDTKRIVSGSGDKTVRVWDISSLDNPK